MTTKTRRRQLNTLTDYMGIIRNDVTDAVNFVTSEFVSDFAAADRYYDGEVDLPRTNGRSSVVSTQVRDAVRNMRPSIMRVLCSNRERLVKYTPSSIQYAAAIDQQTAYVHQLFWRSNGYMALYQMMDETLRHRFGPVKTYWDANPAPQFSRISGLTIDEVNAIAAMPEVEIVSVESNADADEQDDEMLPTDREQEPELFTIEVVKEAANGAIRIQAVPYGEFFISRNAQSVQDARVHGHRRAVTVAEAIEMGIDYDDWDDLDYLDPQEADVPTQAVAKRGYHREEQMRRGDPLSREFLLTEAYVKLDLDDSGYQQLYALYLGGTNYELLDFQRIQESPFDLAVHDIRTFSPFGYSVADVTMKSQDVITSLLRGILDNVHASNQPRLAANPSQVNFDDLMNHSIGHPLRLKTPQAVVQVISIPSQVQQALPMLTWLEQDAQNKVGVTKAAQGLDPNAMQSTDKDAVRNTIQLSQGQVELAVRNIIETAVIPMFKKLLRLSIQHLDRVQIIQTQGMFVPVDQLYFDSDCYAEALVGLGTVSQEQRMAGLQATLAQQMQIMNTIGMNNPFVTASHVYNTIEDLTRMYGLDNVGRYFNHVTPEGEAAYAKQKAEEAAKAAPPPPDPTAALVQIEQLKAQAKAQETAVTAANDRAKMQLDAIKLQMQDDLERDKLAQQRQLDAAKLLADTGVRVDQNQIKLEQAAPRRSPASAAAGGAGAPTTSPAAAS